MVFPPELLELPPLLDEEPPEEEEELDEDIPLPEPLELLPLLPEPELPFIPDELPELAIPLDDPLAPDDPEEEEALLSPPPAFPTEPQERREQRAMSENDFIWIWSFVFGFLAIVSACITNGHPQPEQCGCFGPAAELTSPE